MNYILQERLAFAPVIETPHGPTQVEIRIMYVWTDELQPVLPLLRLGRGRMMGVDHNKGLRWVGASGGADRGRHEAPALACASPSPRCAVAARRSASAWPLPPLAPTAALRFLLFIPPDPGRRARRRLPARRAWRRCSARFRRVLLLPALVLVALAGEDVYPLILYCIIGLGAAVLAGRLARGPGATCSAACASSRRCSASRRSASASPTIGECRNISVNPAFAEMLRIDSARQRFAVGARARTPAVRGREATACRSPPEDLPAAGGRPPRSRGEEHRARRHPSRRHAPHALRVRGAAVRRRGQGPRAPWARSSTSPS